MHRIKMSAVTFMKVFQIVVIITTHIKEEVDATQTPVCDPVCIHGTCTLPHTASVVGRSSHTRTLITRCHCQQGWSGTQCNIKDTICQVNPCLNQAWCLSQSVEPFYSCICMPGYTGSHCQIVHSINSDEKQCNKVTTVTQIAELVTVTHDLAGECKPASDIHDSPDAFVILHCGLQDMGSWYRGMNVMNNCTDIPNYTPIAAFPPQSYYTSSGAWSGIFLGCINGGFRMAMQKCGEHAKITHILSGGIGNQDPTFYYTVQ